MEVPREFHQCLKTLFYGVLVLCFTSSCFVLADTLHPLGMIAVQNATMDLCDDVSVQINVETEILGVNGEDTEWVTIDIVNPNGTDDDWLAVFSPSNFNASTCPGESDRSQSPFMCTSPIKYKFANFGSSNYTQTGRNSLTFQLINQRADFSFGLFSGGLSNPKLIGVSKNITFANPKAPLYPRLAQGKSWNEMTVTWTSGYNVDEAVPIVAWGRKLEDTRKHTAAGTLTFDRNSMCGAPARTVGWRDPGFFHTAFLKDLWPNTEYTYQIGHLLNDGSYVWGKSYTFKASPFPGQDSLQRIIVFGDMGKGERDGSNEYSNFQPGALSTMDRLLEDKDNYDMVLHIGDLSYANGYLADWDQFTAQIEPIAATRPYMIGSGNHERDSPGTGSFYTNDDSGGECGVPTETMFYAPTENRNKFWYMTEHGMFRFCIADSEQDFRIGTEQHKFIEHCFATTDRRKTPWLIFAAHRPLGYCSSWYFVHRTGSFGEPMGREHLEKLWQKYKVDIAIYGHVHYYQRTCPVYENTCMKDGDQHDYRGPLKGTIHVVAGGAGAKLTDWGWVDTPWSVYWDKNYGFAKMTAYNHSHLEFEYKRSGDGQVYDHFSITRDYPDILACQVDSCPETTMTH